MRSTSARIWWVGGILGVIALAALAPLGCEQHSGYDSALRYPPREDVIVVTPPSDTPTAPTPQGNLAAHFASYAQLPGAQIIDPHTIGVAEREALQATLLELFGTPAQPKTPTTSNADMSRGSQVYRRQCASCHSLTGNSRGPGEWMTPFPRDYRTGKFKTAITHSKPSPDALAATIRRGVPGTVMQAYDLMSDEDLKAVTGYVIHLAQRGETEIRVIRELAEEESSASEVPTLTRTMADKIAAEWQAAAVPPPKLITPPTDTDSIRRGHKLFAHANGANCISCHAGYGKTETYRYDSWGIATRLPDLTRGEFRWGRESIALRIRHGIAASGMPSHPNLSEDEVRDLAAFVQVISQPERLPEDVRLAVYPNMENSP
jgi:mono/diheme cytochrome c family protein